MTDLTKFRAELRAGLDGVLPGSWGAFATIVSAARNVSPNAVHIARCSPENIRAILDALDTAERERDEARDANEVRGWHEGEPPKPWRDEWFIAETIQGARIVLKALPEEYSYDYRTADETYLMSRNVKRWMRFPDSEFVEPKP
jgi:hypothetical protein